MLTINSIRSQAGMTIIEALVAIVILSILGLGSAFIASKTMVVQREASLNSLVINGERNITQQQDCTSIATLSVNNQKNLNQSVSCASNAKTVTLTALDASKSLLFQINTTINIPSVTTTSNSSLVKGNISIQP